jgi:tetratricopeptide (TPR) repeat protein
MPRKMHSDNAPFPSGGQLIGWVVRALQLTRSEPYKSQLTSTSAERYFEGSTPVKDDTARRVLQAVAGAWVERGYLQVPTSSQAGASLTSALEAALGGLVARWDAFRGHVHSRAAPTRHPGVLAAFLRQLVIDLALRWTALLRLQGEPPPEAQVPAWACEEGWAEPIRRLLQHPSGRLTREQLQGELALGALKSMENWLYAGSRPGHLSLSDLAEAYAEREPTVSVEEHRRRLQLHWALASLAEALAARVSWADVGDMAEALVRFTRHVHMGLERSRLSVEQQHASMWSMLALGWQYAPAMDLVRYMRQTRPPFAWLAEVNGVLEGPEERLRWQVATLARAAELSTRLQQELGMSPSAAEALLAQGVRWGPRAGDTPIHSLPREAQESLLRDPEFRAGVASAEAEAQLCQGNWAGAAAAFRRAVAAHPRNADLHFRLGAALGKSGQKEEALLELAISEQMDPNSYLAPTEVGIVFLDSDATELALAQLESVASRFAGEPHVLYHLAIARMRMRQWARALEAFEAVLEKQPMHALALDSAAICAFQAGHTDKGASLAKRALALGVADTHQLWKNGVFRKK